MKIKKVALEAHVNISSTYFKDVAKPIFLTHSMAEKTSGWPSYLSDHGPIGPFDWNTIVRGTNGNPSKVALGFTNDGVLVGAAHARCMSNVLQLTHLESNKQEGPWKGMILPQVLLGLNLTRMVLSDQYQLSTPVKLEVCDVVPGFGEHYCKVALAIGMEAVQEGSTIKLFDPVIGY